MKHLQEKNTFEFVILLMFGLTASICLIHFNVHINNLVFPTNIFETSFYFEIFNSTDIFKKLLFILFNKYAALCYEKRLGVSLIHSYDGLNGPN